MSCLSHILIHILKMAFICSLLPTLTSPVMAQGPSKSKSEKERLAKSQKAIWLAHILRRKNIRSRISEMDIKLKEIPVYMIPKGGKLRPLIKLKLFYDRKDWRLFVGENTPLKRKHNQNYIMIFAFLNARISEIQLTARGPADEVETEKLFVFSPEAREYQMVSPFDAVLFHLGLAYTVYEQTSFGVFTSQSLFLGASYLSPETTTPWGLLVDGNITFYTYTSAPIDDNPQLYDVRLAGTYRFQLHQKSLWRSRIFLGVNSLGLIAHGSPFGFSGLAGLSMGLHSDFFQTNNITYGYEVGYSTYNQLQLAEDREFYFQVSWIKNLNNLREFKAYFTWSNNHFKSGIEDVKLDLVRLGLALTF